MDTEFVPNGAIEEVPSDPTAEQDKIDKMLEELRGKLGAPVVLTPGVSVVPDPTIHIPPRLVVVENIYYQIPNQQPTIFYNGYTELITSDEQPYGPRHLKVTEEPVKVDKGWINRTASLLVIRNDEGLGRLKIPTAAEVEDTNKRIIEIGYMVQRITIEGGQVPKSMRTMHTRDQVPVVKEITEFVPLFLVKPGRTCRICPNNLDELYIRSRYDSARYTWTLYPE